MISPLFSVVVSTYNRCPELAHVLECLSAQETGGRFGYEVIIADNNSTDRTRETVAAFAPRFHGRLRYLFERRQGKSFALNAGIGQSRGEIVAFTDDDVLFNTSWLENLRRCFERHGCDAVGGRILPLYPPGAPIWTIAYRDILEGPVGAHDYGDEVKPYDRSRMAPFAGANIAVRARCFDTPDWFRVDLGAGSGLPPGEDTELFKQLQLKGKKIYYCGDAVVYHRVAINKLNYRHVSSWALKNGYFTVRREPLKTGICYFGYPRWILRRCLREFLVLGTRIFNHGEFIRNWIAAVSTLGEMIEYRRLRNEELRAGYAAQPRAACPIGATDGRTTPLEAAPGEIAGVFESPGETLAGNAPASPGDTVA